jgi:cytochrome c peroxidase
MRAAPLLSFVVFGLLVAHVAHPSPVGAQTKVVPPPVTGLDSVVPVPQDNPLTVEVLLLGRRLFFDTELSSDRSRSCSSCHLPERSFSDSVAHSAGVEGRTGKRNAPSLVNRAWSTSLTWDGRAGSLEDQVLLPIKDTRELNLPIDEVLERLTADPSYRSQFRDAFSALPDSTTLARALASYVRVIRAGDAPFDRYRAGDREALSPSARRGLSLFFGRAGCAQCHTGANLTDDKFHNTGVGVTYSDSGRAYVTKQVTDAGAFRTPSLRDVAGTGPYMHDGSLATIEAVLDFYNTGGIANPNLDHSIKPLKLSSAEKQDLADFLRALSSPALTCAPIRCTP